MNLSGNKVVELASILEEKYALVLGGGGAKGAYQIGVWKACLEMNIRFQATFGTSVGALNAALIAQGNFKKAEKLWQNIRIEDIFRVPDRFLKDGNLHLDLSNIFYIRELLKDGGLNTLPLKNIIEKNVNEEKIRSSKLDFGLVTYEISNLRPVELFLDEIRHGMLARYLLASSSLPGFRSTRINGKRFIDGGIHDNIPFDLAKKRGYRKILVVDVSAIGNNRKPNVEDTQTVYIKNSIEMGNILEFTPAFTVPFMKLGYLDTKRVFGELIGIDYFYSKDTSRLRHLEKLLISDRVYKQFSPFLDRHLEYRQNRMQQLRDLLPERFRFHHSIIMGFAECTALLLKIERLESYKFSDFIRILWNRFMFLSSNNTGSITNFKPNWLSRISDHLDPLVIPAKVFLTLIRQYLTLPPFLAPPWKK